MKAIIYARQSSGSDDFSESIEQQIYNCKAIADKENLEIIGVFSDLNTSGKTYPEGAEPVARLDMAFQIWFKEQTGSKMFRAGLGNVLAQIDKIDFIIVDDLTRLYRPIAKSFLEGYINQILEINNIKIQTVKSGTIDLSKFNDTLISTLQSRINDNQIAIQRKKSMDALKKLKNGGILPTGSRCYGFKYFPYKKEIEIVREEAKVIKYIFEEVAKHKPYLQIISHINENHSSIIKGKALYESTFYSICRQPLYCGLMYNSDGDLIKNVQMEGKEIISFDLWQTVQQIMAANRRNPPKAKFRWLPFSGILVCGNCGSKMVSGSDNGKTFYYCQNANRKKDSGCAQSRVIIDGEKDLYCGLKEAISPFLILSCIIRQDKELELKKARENLSDLQIELANLKTQKSKIMDMFLKNLVTADEMEIALGDHKKTEIDLNRKIIEAQVPADNTLSRQWKKVIKFFAVEHLIKNDISNSDFETMLKESIKKITCHFKKIVIETVYGEVPLNRYMAKNKRNFPKFESTMISEDNFEVTYRYSTGEKELIADFGKIKIFQK